MQKEETTGRIIKCAFEVSNELGSGFLESVYQNALMLALKDSGLEAAKEYPINVAFRNRQVGRFFADILVEGEIIVELKAVSKLANEHYAQVINYLKASDRHVALLMNFGRPKLEFRRFDNRMMRELKGP